jgi:pyruvate-ferredoxin/flavodoxin oxidoreductase
MDSKAPTLDFAEFAYGQNRFRSLTKSKPEVAEKLIELSKKDTVRKQSLLNQLANLDCEC